MTHMSHPVGATGHARRPRPRPVARGRCTLVGAGPGDPELLTLKAVKAIRAATVLLVDDLVGDEVVERALRGKRRRPRIVHVGKRGGCASTPQVFIERLMVAEAQRGEQVVRLKGGDPLVFGRAGEEMQALRRAGIEVDVVNGITAGLAAASAVGGSLTQRTLAHGVMFITGHAHPGAGERDWQAIGAVAAQGITLVVYMGVKQVDALQHGLLQRLDARTPVAVVQHASLPRQRTVLSTLGDLGKMLEREGLGSPAVIVVGDVLHASALALQATRQAVPPATRSTARRRRTG